MLIMFIIKTFRDRYFWQIVPLDIENITWPLRDTNFIFECWKYLSPVRFAHSWVACVAWRFCRAGRRSGVAAKFAREARENERRSREKNKNKLLPPQSPRGFSALARLYYLARPTKTAMLRRLTRERYFQHSKIKFVSLSGHVIFCLFYRCWWNSYIKHNFFYLFSKKQNSATKVVTYRKMPVTKMLWNLDIKL